MSRVLAGASADFGLTFLAIIVVLVGTPVLARARGPRPAYSIALVVASLGFLAGLWGPHLGLLPSITNYP